VDQYIDNRHKEILWDLLDNPADSGELYASTLQRLVNEHPQSGLLQVLLARANGSHDIQKAAAYFNTKALYKLVHNPEGLAFVNSGKIVKARAALLTNLGIYADTSISIAEEEAEVVTGAEQPHEENQAKPQIENISDEPETTTGPVPLEVDTDSESVSNEPKTIIVEGAPEEEPEIKANPYNYDTTRGFEQPVDEPELATENTFALAEEPEPEEEQSFTHAAEDRREEKEYFRQDIEDEIYDEIVGIEEIGISKPVTPPDIHTEAAASLETVWPETEEQEYTVEEEDEYYLPALKPLKAELFAINEAEERLILGNIVSADYLAVDKRLDELHNGSTKPAETEAIPANETQELSRYNDDKMPYSFMWWLDKTRKEHADSFQPYTVHPVIEKVVAADEPSAEKNTDNTAYRPEQVKPVRRKAPDELQQQYYENIFSLTSVSNIEGNEDAPVAFDHSKKEDIIIERFITAEPQIKPPSADKLDNENKAKKSSEDQDALVTETLARIYTDQMLYHKAIATYKKLLLKFPEKKLYFASQIEQLEKKTN
jgi:hypothetical protein